MSQMRSFESLQVGDIIFDPNAHGGKRTISRITIDEYMDHTFYSTNRDWLILRLVPHDEPFRCVKKDDLSTLILCFSSKEELVLPTVEHLKAKQIAQNLNILTMDYTRIDILHLPSTELTRKKVNDAIEEVKCRLKKELYVDTYPDTPLDFTIDVVVTLGRPKTLGQLLVDIENVICNKNNALSKE